MKKMQVRDILNIKVITKDFDEDVTVRQYLHKLLKTLWDENEGFSGKRPFGNSGWQYDLALTFVVNRVIPGSYIYDETDDVYDDFDFEWEDVDNIIEKCLNNIFLPPIGTNTKLEL